MIEPHLFHLLLACLVMKLPGSKFSGIILEKMCFVCKMDIKFWNQGVFVCEMGFCRNSAKVFWWQILGIEYCVMISNSKYNTELGHQFSQMYAKFRFGFPLLEYLLVLAGYVFSNDLWIHQQKQHDWLYNFFLEAM